MNHCTKLQAVCCNSILPQFFAHGPCAVLHVRVRLAQLCFINYHVENCEKFLHVTLLKIYLNISQCVLEGFFNVPKIPVWWSDFNINLTFIGS